MKYRNYAYYAYTAGVIDCDGCITIQKQSPRKVGWSPSYGLYVEVTQTDGRAIDFLVGFWGGRYYKYNYSSQKQPIYKWRRYGDDAVDLLKKVSPFLRYKQEQAQVAIEFRLFQKRFLKIHRAARLPQDALDRFEEYKQRLSTLHHTFEAAKALATTKRDNSSEEEK